MSNGTVSYDLKTGFDGVLFDIAADPRSGVYRDWIIRPVVRETHIPGTNRTYIERLGYEPARVTWTLRFWHPNDYYDLLEKYLMTGTLTVLAGYQSLKGTDYHHLGHDYTELDNVVLREIGDSPHFVDGVVETEVTFQRAVDPVTRLAVVS